MRMPWAEIVKQQLLQLLLVFQVSLSVKIRKASLDPVEASIDMALAKIVPQLKLAHSEAMPLTHGSRHFLQTTSNKYVSGGTSHRQYFHPR